MHSNVPGCLAPTSSRLMLISVMTHGSHEPARPVLHVLAVFCTLLLPFDGDVPHEHVNSMPLGPSDVPAGLVQAH